MPESYQEYLERKSKSRQQHLDSLDTEIARKVLDLLAELDKLKNSLDSK